MTDDQVVFHSDHAVPTFARRGANDGGRSLFSSDFANGRVAIASSRAGIAGIAIRLCRRRSFWFPLQLQKTERLPPLVTNDMNVGKAPMRGHWG